MRDQSQPIQLDQDRTMVTVLPMALLVERIAPDDLNPACKHEVILIRRAVLAVLVPVGSDVGACGSCVTRTAFKRRSCRPVRANQVKPVGAKTIEHGPVTRFPSFLAVTTPDV